MLQAETTMAPSVETMSLPYQSNKSLLDAVAAAAASAEQLPTNNGESATTTVATSGNKTSSTSAAANNTKTYTTPKRPAGTAQVTPGTCSKEDGGDGGNNSVEEQNNSTADGGGERAIVSASSTDETAADSRSSSPNKSMPPPPAVSGGQAASASSVQVASAQKISKISSSVVVAPSIQLGPRVTPAVRKNPPPQSCMKPRSLEGVLEKGVGERTTTAQFQLQKSTTGGRSSATSKKKVPSATLSIAQQVAALDGGGVGQTVKQEGPSTPSGQTQSNLPAPSSFLAAKISPLRSSARRNGEKNKGETANNDAATASSSAGMTLKREGTPPPAASDDQAKLSPGMFLSPRTPHPHDQHHHARSGVGGTAHKMSGISSGMTPRGLNPGLTPTNFAMDFGRGNRKEDGTAVDPNNVFAWLQSPGQGLFSPSGGLNSYSTTNTPRGMYGFSGPIKLEAGGDIGVNTPKVPSSHNSMICISPLASRRGGKNKQSAAGGGMDAPDTPMSINFSEVFASPRLPTPRMKGAKKGDGTSNDGQASPVASALHSAERDVNLDDDLNALLQLAETATPGGGRPMTFMSPLLTNSLRRAMPPAVHPPSSLQLPMITGSSISPKFGRSASASGDKTVSPPQLAIRSTSSSGRLDGSTAPTKSSLRKKSKKRKTPTDVTSSEYYTQHDHQQPMGYSHPSMTHYGHPHMASHPTAAQHQGYYQPDYHGGSHERGGYIYSGHPGPQQHYAYSDQHQLHDAEEEDPSSGNPAPKKRGRGRPRGKTTGPPKPRGRPKKEPGAPKSAPRSAPMTVSRPPSSSRRGEPSAMIGQSIADKVKTRRSPPNVPSVHLEEIEEPEVPAPTPGKRARKSTARAANSGVKRPRKVSAKHAPASPEDRDRITAAIRAVNDVYGNGKEKRKKLESVTLRGVTCRPSGKWQAQLYYAGKSRYIGVFDSKEKASLAYEIAREVLKTDEEPSNPNQEQTNAAVSLARKAAFAGINDLEN